MADSGLESQQAINDVKETAVVLKFDLLWSKIHHETNPIDNILMKDRFELGAECPGGGICGAGGLVGPI